MTAVPEFDELLSAYLDGELSPAETARVERMLAGSPQLRAVVDEYRSIGTSLRALPVPALDDQFASRVLAGVGPVAGSRGGVSAVGRSWWNRRSAQVALAACLGTGLAAMLMLALRGPMAEPGAPSVAVHQPDTPRPAFTPVVGTPGHETAVAVAEPKPGEAVAAKGTEAGSEMTLANGVNPRELVGRIVEAWDPKGVAVVRVYVVDYDATWERLQVVLEERAFATTTQPPETKAGDLVAVLAEGTPDKIGEALAALASDNGVVAVDVAEEPLLVASLDERVKAGFSPVAMAPRPGLKQPGEPATEASGLRTRSTGTPGAFAPGSAAPLRTGSAPAGLTLDAPVAWARPVAVPQGVLPAGHPVTARGSETAPAAAANAKAPLQVLFVLEQRK